MVFGRAAEGFAEEAGGTFYSTGDFKDSLVQGLYGAAMNVALGGFGDIAAKHLASLASVDWAFGGRRKNSIRPNLGPDSFRNALAKHWGLPKPPDGMVAHHVFPLKFAKRFRKAGIEPDNTWYGAWWEAADHRKKADEYNLLWEQFFEMTPRPTIEQIIEEGMELSQRYGIDWYKG